MSDEQFKEITMLLKFIMVLVSTLVGALVIGPLFR